MQLLHRTHIDSQSIEAVTFRHINIVDIVWVFTIASVLGLIGETLVSYPIDGVWKNRTGFVWGMFSPIYGVGAVLMTVMGDNTRHRGPLAVFLACAVAGAGLEFFGGYTLEKFFGICAWDYSSDPLSIMGYTSLSFAALWGALGLLWTEYVLPHIPGALDKLPHKLYQYGAVGPALFFTADSVATIVAFDCWWCELAGQAATTPFQQFLMSHFSDAYMTGKFQTITIWPDTATRNALMLLPR